MRLREAIVGAQRSRTAAQEVHRLAINLPLVALLVFTACGDTESSVARGDRFWADSNYASALAEYRLALRRSSDDPAVMLRVAHAYAMEGQLVPAREAYDRLLAVASQHSDQAVFDYVTLARTALARGDRYGMATAIEAALKLQPGLPLTPFAEPLARYYATTGDTDRALIFYQRAAAAMTPDSSGRLQFAIATIQESQGNCREAIQQFQEFLLKLPRGGQSDQARFHIGTCSFQLAREAREAGRRDDALVYIDRVIELGLPQNLQDQAWFERGEILLEQGRPEEALAAYHRVLDLNPLRAGQLVERTQKRIDQVRFGPS
jgi:tetratricopeptide (TPR) repeat protein